MKLNTLKNTLKKQYSQIPNELITDMDISSGALRVLLYLFTKSDDWNVYNKDICKQLTINEKTLTKYWKILLSSNWLRRKIASEGEGKFTGGYVYHIGNFSISVKSSETEESGEHNNNKLINQQETNRDTLVSPTKIANFLLKNILKHKPNFVCKNFDSWVKDIEKAMRLDKRTEQELIGCINWIYQHKDGAFWIPNILSGKKFREKFDTMESRMMSSNKSDNQLDAMLAAYNAN